MTNSQDRGSASASAKGTLALSGIFLSTLLLGVVDTKLEDHAPQLHHTLGFLLFVLATGCTFVWLSQDQPEIAYRRSNALNIAIIFLPAIFIPFYLYKSRAPKHRLRALLRFAYFLVGLFLAYGVGVNLLQKH